MAQLGEILMERGWVTPEQLQLARRRQNELGGRIGTCLLEIGAISEELLLRALSEQVGVPRVPIRDLHGIPGEVSSLLSSEKAIRYRAIPFRQLGGQVEVALEEVSDLRIQDEISFLLGKRVNIHIANEARIAEALLNVYGHPCSARIQQLLTRLNRSRAFHRTGHGGVPPSSPARSAASEPRLAPPSLAYAPAADSTARPGPTIAREEVRSALKPGFGTRPIPIHELTETGVREAPIPESGKSPRAPAGSPLVDSPTALSAGGDIAAAGRSPRVGFEERIVAAKDTDELGRLLLEEMARRFDRAVLFHRRGGAMHGWKAAGAGLDVERLRRFSCPLDIPSVFLTLSQGGGYFVGQLPAFPAHRRLASFLESEARTNCLVTPVRLNDRLVCALLTDRADDAFATDEIDFARRLAAQAELAFRIRILRDKLHELSVISEPATVGN